MCKTIAHVPLTPTENAGFATGDDGKQRVTRTALLAPTRRSTAKRRVRCGWVGVLGVFTSKSSQNSPLRASLRSKGSRSRRGGKKGAAEVSARRAQLEQQGRVSDRLLILGKWEDEATSFLWEVKYGRQVCGSQRRKGCCYGALAWGWLRGLVRGNSGSSSMPVPSAKVLWPLNLGPQVP